MVQGSVTTTALPQLIQGGMGVSVSSWQLANAVARAGQLGVVSGTAPEVAVIRRLQLGDPDGSIRRALAAFPDAAMARRFMRQYYIHGGKDPDAMFRPLPMFTIEPERELIEATVLGSFIDVWLAKHGHEVPGVLEPGASAPAVMGPVGINFLRKIEMPLPFGLLGAMLAGVDYVIVGAGNPSDLPGMIRTLAAGADLRYTVRGQGFTSADAPLVMQCSPREILGPLAGTLPEPRFLAIAASEALAAALIADPASRPFGIIIEGPTAGGHNAPPRGPRRTDDLGQPVYDERDHVDLGSIAALGVPFWLAGSYGDPDAFAAARAAGAAGVQIGTAFAYCAESGLAPDLRRKVLAALADGTLEVRTDWRASPTGFPFKVVQLPGTIADPEVASRRKLVCDLAYLRTPYRTASGEVDYRCPSEPVRVYVQRKGGREANTVGRKCLCNGLLAAAGLPQVRPRTGAEPPLVTSGDDFRAVAHLAAQLPPGREFFRAVDVIDHVLGAR